MKLFSIFGELLLKDTLTPGLDKAESKAKGLSDIFDVSFGKIAGAALKLGAILGVSLGFKDLFDKASAGQQAMAQMGAVLQSTGGKAGMTQDALVKLAQAQSQVTTFSKGANIATENLLLTFTNIGQKTFPQALSAVNDMSQALGQDTKTSAIQLGKALNDPVKGVTALQKVGVTFTQQQKDQIAAMMKTNNIAGAQGIILKELGTEFGGSAVAAGKTFAGQLTILQNQLTGVGVGIVSKLLPPLTDFMSTINNHMPQIQAIIGNAVDFIGKTISTAVPIVKGIISDVVGIATKIFPSLGKSTDDLGNKLLSLIGNTLTPIKNAFNDVFTFISRNSPQIKDTISKAVDGISKTIQFLFPIFEDIVQDITKIGMAILPLVVDLFPKMNSGASGLGGVLADLAKNGLTAVKDILDWLANHGAVVKDAVIGIGIAFGTWKTIETAKNIINGAKDAINTTKDAFNNVKSAIDTARLKFMYFQDGVLSVSTKVSNFKDKILNGLSSAFDAVGNATKSAGSKLADFGSKAADVAGNALSKIAGLAKSAGSAVLDFGKSIADAAISAGKMTLELGKQAIAWIAQKAQLIATTIAEGAATVAQTALNLAMMLNPIGIIVIAIAGLVAAIVVLYNKNVWFRDLVNSVFSFVRSFIMGAINDIVGFFKNMVAGAESTGQGIKDKFNAVCNFFSGLPAKFLQFGKDIINGLKDGAWGILSGIGGWIKDKFNAFVTFFKNLPGDALKWGADIINSLGEGIKSKFNDIVGFAKDLGQKILEGIKGIFGIHSPSREMFKIGDYLMQGFKNGINTHNIGDLVKSVFGNVTSLAKGALGKPLGVMLKPLVDSGAFQKIGSLISGVVKGGSSFFSSLVGGSSNVSGSVMDWLTQAIMATGQSMSTLPALAQIAQHESGGNPNAVNNWDSNAKAGHPSKGLMQTISSTFAEYMLPGHGNILNPVDNAIAAIRYMISRYGSVANVPGIKSLMSGGPYVGYATGTPSALPGWSWIGEHGKELMRMQGGEQIIDHDTSMKLTQGGNGLTLNIQNMTLNGYNDTKKFARDLYALQQDYNKGKGGN